ncbi:hypothetical protein F5B20DRAFT_523287, partial [Whalleya microplaca]
MRLGGDAMVVTYKLGLMAQLLTTLAPPTDAADLLLFSHLETTGKSGIGPLRDHEPISSRIVAQQAGFPMCELSDLPESH